MKICVICNKEHNRKSDFCSHTCNCKQYKKDHKEEIVEYHSKWYQDNRENQSQYYQDHKEEIVEYNSKWYQDNKENELIKKAQYYQEHKEEIAQYNQEHKEEKAVKAKQRYNENVNARLAHILRSRLNSALKNCQKVGSAVRDLGCTIDELRQYLESLFQPGMTWENQGRRIKNGWEIDHIFPLSRMDLQDEEEFKKANHYTNLKPEWKINNLKKGNKFTEFNKYITNIGRAYGVSKS
jgi:hypothetical protein